MAALSVARIFGGMVRIVVDHGDAVAALDLESPIDALKVLESRGNDGRLDAHVARCGKRGSRVQNVVHAGNVQLESLGRSAVESQREGGAKPCRAWISTIETSACAAVPKVTNRRFIRGNQRLNRGIVKAQDRGAIERNLVHE